MSKETIPQSIIDKIDKQYPDVIGLAWQQNVYAQREAAIWGAFELDKWISVKDGLPEDGNDWYWCAKGENIMLQAYQYSKKYGWWAYGEPAPDAGITHYMPIPKPPKSI